MPRVVEATTGNNYNESTADNINGMQNDNQHIGKSNFALAYIYYWKEVDANNTSAASPPLSNNGKND